MPPPAEAQRRAEQEAELASEGTLDFPSADAVPAGDSIGFVRHTRQVNAAHNEAMERLRERKAARRQAAAAAAAAAVASRAGTIEQLHELTEEAEAQWNDSLVELLQVRVDVENTSRSKRPAACNSWNVQLSFGF